MSLKSLSSYDPYYHIEDNKYNCVEYYPRTIKIINYDFTENRNYEKNKKEVHKRTFLNNTIIFKGKGNENGNDIEFYYKNKIFKNLNEESLIDFFSYYFKFFGLGLNYLRELVDNNDIRLNKYQEHYLCNRAMSFKLNNLLPDKNIYFIDYNEGLQLVKIETLGDYYETIAWEHSESESEYYNMYHNKGIPDSVGGDIFVIKDSEQMYKEYNATECYWGVKYEEKVLKKNKKKVDKILKKMDFNSNNIYYGYSFSR